MAGGCLLNGLVNTRISEDLDLKNQFVQPASTDDGTAIGAAFLYGICYWEIKIDTIWRMF